MSLSFFKQWLKAPATVGAVAPSSRCLADAMAHGVESFEAIVEVGAGTGVVTDSLVRRHPSARLIVFELGDQLAADLKGGFLRRMWSAVRFIRTFRSCKTCQRRRLLSPDYRFVRFRLV